jgi:hypothetical protein
VKQDFQSENVRESQKVVNVRVSNDNRIVSAGNDAFASRINQIKSEAEKAEQRHLHRLKTKAEKQE